MTPPLTPLTDAERLSQLRLIRSEGIGPRRFATLIERYGSAEEALYHLPTLINQRNLTLTIAPLATIEQEIEACHAIGATLLCASDPAYPPLLKEISDAPPIITVLGDVSLLHRHSLAIVGSRNASINAQQLTRKLASELTDQGIIVTSGLARGIDTAAHHGALAGGTIAVIAGGIDTIYPPENTSLRNQLATDGLIVTEMPFGAYPKARHFPRRNRIISGISHGVLVIEAMMGSGSLITAKMALEQNREVFAIPGFPLDPRAKGTNSLIKQGATLVESVMDILAVIGNVATPLPSSLPATAATSPPPTTTTQDQETILAVLDSTPVAIDDIIQNTPLSPARVNSLLLELELDGHIERNSGGMVRRLHG